MEFLVLVPSLFTLVMGGSTMALAYSAYRIHQVPYLKRLFQLLLPTTFPSLVFLVFLFVRGEEFVQLRTFFGAFGVLSGMTAYLVFYLKIRALSDSPVGLRNYAMVGYLYFSAGMFAMAIHWGWNGHTWAVSYEPLAALFAFGLGVMWLVFEFLSFSYHVYRDSSRGGYLVLIIIGNYFFFLAAVVSLLERLVFSESSAFFLVFQGVSYFLLTIGLIGDPSIFLPQNIGSKFLVIANYRSGLPVLEYRFVDEESKSSSLFAAAMSSIISFIQEQAREEGVPRSMNFLNFHVMIERVGEVIGYYVAERECEVIRYLLRNILEEVGANLVESIQPLDDPGSFQLRIASTFSFAL